MVAGPWVLVLLVAGLAGSAFSAEALQEEPVRRIELALDRGDFPSARDAAAAWVQEHPKSPEARVLLARAEMGLNQPGDALRDLREALRLDLHNVDALYFVSKLAAVLSGQEFLQLEKVAPDSLRTHQLRAEALTATGDNAGAEREYLAALEHKPNAVFLLNGLGDLQRHQEHYKQASAWYGKALKIEPDNSDALYGLGACFLLAHEPAKAISLFRHALKTDPESTAAAMALGEALLDTGGAREATALLQRAAEADPELKRVQFLLGRAYRATGQEKESQLAFDRYRELTKQSSLANPLHLETQP